VVALVDAANSWWRLRIARHVLHNAAGVPASILDALRCKRLPVAAVPNDGQIPLEALRDLIALARALYAALRNMGPGYSDQLFQLRRIGAQLTLALEKAENSKPGTFAHKSAWLISEDAVRDLGQLVDVYLPARNLLAAASERIFRKS
jgi:hypothetical protein